MKTKKVKILFLLLTIFTVVFFSFRIAHAADWLDNPFSVITPPAGATAAPEATINKGLNLFFTIAEIAFIVLLLVGGISYLTGMGNEEQVGKARKMIVEAIIGIVIIFAAWGVGTWILNNLKGGGGGINPNISGGTNAATGTPTSGSPTGGTSNPTANSTIGTTALPATIVHDSSTLEDNGNVVMNCVKITTPSNISDVTQYYQGTLWKRGTANAYTTVWGIAGDASHINNTSNVLCSSVGLSNYKDYWNGWNSQVVVIYDTNTKQYYVSNKLNYNFMQEGKLTTSTPVSQAAPSLQELGIK